MGEKLNNSVVVTLKKGRSYHENPLSDHFWMRSSWKTNACYFTVITFLGRTRFCRLSVDGLHSIINRAVPCRALVLIHFSLSVYRTDSWFVICAVLVRDQITQKQMRLWYPSSANCTHKESQRRMKTNYFSSRKWFSSYTELKQGNSVLHSLRVPWLDGWFLFPMSWLSS